MNIARWPALLAALLLINGLMAAPTTPSIAAGGGPIKIFCRNQTSLLNAGGTAMNGEFIAEVWQREDMYNTRSFIASVEESSSPQPARMMGFGLLLDTGVTMNSSWSWETGVMTTTLQPGQSSGIYTNRYEVPLALAGYSQADYTRPYAWRINLAVGISSVRFVRFNGAQSEVYLCQMGEPVNGPLPYEDLPPPEGRVVCISNNSGANEWMATRTEVIDLKMPGVMFVRMQTIVDAQTTTPLWHGLVLEDGVYDPGPHDFPVTVTLLDTESTASLSATVKTNSSDPQTIQYTGWSHAFNGIYTSLWRLNYSDPAQLRGVMTVLSRDSNTVAPQMWWAANCHPEWNANSFAVSFPQAMVETEPADFYSGEITTVSGVQRRTTATIRAYADEGLTQDLGYTIPVFNIGDDRAGYYISLPEQGDVWLVITETTPGIFRGDISVMKLDRTTDTPPIEEPPGEDPPGEEPVPGQPEHRLFLVLIVK